MRVVLVLRRFLNNVYLAGKYLLGKNNRMCCYIKKNRPREKINDNRIFYLITNLVVQHTLSVLKYIAITLIVKFGTVVSFIL